MQNPCPFEHDERQHDLELILADHLEQFSMAEANDAVEATRAYLNELLDGYLFPENVDNGHAT